MVDLMMSISRVDAGWWSGDLFVENLRSEIMIEILVSGCDDDGRGGALDAMI